MKFSIFPVHLWRYRGGYPALTEVMNKLKQNQVSDPEPGPGSRRSKRSGVDWRVSAGRSSWPTGKSAGRCWCRAEISSCWSSASGTSPCLARDPTSMSSGPTSSGWGTHRGVYVTARAAWASVKRDHYSIPAVIPEDSGSNISQMAAVDM